MLNFKDLQNLVSLQKKNYFLKNPVIERTIRVAKKCKKNDK